MMMENIDTIDIESIIKDPTLFSSIDIEKLLGSIENEKNSYLENKTSYDITKEIFDILQESRIPMDKIKDYSKKLLGYRYIDDIRDLHKGKHIRWIKRDNPSASMTNGAILVNIKFLDNGTHIVCKNSQNRFFQIKLDSCYIFQKMTTEEHLIIMAYDYIRKS